MNRAIPNLFVSIKRRWLPFLLSFAVGTLMACKVSEGQIDGFTEPFRQIDLSSDETGAIRSLNVDEGERVQKGDIVATLDDRVQSLQLKIATHTANSTSQLVAAKRTLDKRQAIAEQLKLLNSRGHASESEIIRAEMELSIAQAKFLAAQEERAVRIIERERAQVDLERRKIRAPFDGIISKVHRRDGEFLSPLRPEIVTLIQTDRLLATFAVPSSLVQSLEVGQELEIEVGEGQLVVASIYKIGVQTDAQSGTVEVKLVIENQQGTLRAGEMCTLDI